MVFVKHKYGYRKKEIKDLLRERLRLRAKVRHHEQKILETLSKIEQVEESIKEQENLNKKNKEDKRK